MAGARPDWGGNAQDWGAIAPPPCPMLATALFKLHDHFSECLFAMPTIILILTNLIIIMGILRDARQRHQIAVAVVLQRENNSSRSATATLPFIFLFECTKFAIFCNRSLGGHWVYSNARLGDQHKPNILLRILLFHRRSLTIRVSSTFFVYYLRIKFFRDYLLSYFIAAAPKGAVIAGCLCIVEVARDERDA